VTSRWARAWLFAIACSTLSPTQACSPQIEQQVLRLGEQAGAQVAQTLARIEGTGRRLLALRSYLRNRETLAQRWSWTQTQIDEYRQSQEHRDLLSHVENIRVHFERANPGYQLYANTEVRSLDVQIERWNQNAGVERLSAKIERDVCSQSAASLRDQLIAWRPSPPSPLAAPGLSLHGRARAIDFQVHQAGRIVAGPEIAKIADTWDARGWSRKLQTAVHGASNKFKGPLQTPNEPWHYEYSP
jgi:hypothetical protein